ncbi:MAG: sterol desaturase family protein [Pyrinomonadaceae bacterium]
MESNVYTYITPIAIVFLVLEVCACFVLKRDYITFEEAIANFGTALGNQTVNVLVAIGVYAVYGFIWEHYRIFTIDLSWWSFILLLVGVDFVFYWVHRWGHSINIMWAAHSPHHSAEEMNFFVALRASVTQRLASFLFFWVLVVVGFKPFDIYMMAGLHLFIAFLHHTQFIPKLWKPIEFVFTTPSHHRVHHGVNFKYLDKNFSEFLIIWDRIFGTFQEEQEEVVYGIYDHPKSWNPISINFHFYKILWNLAREAPYFWDKIRIWFMPAGWRPRGLEAAEKIEITVENQERFETRIFVGGRAYLVIHLFTAVALMLGVISNLYGWTPATKWVGAALLWWQIINWSGILESKPWLRSSEVIRLIAMSVFTALFLGGTLGTAANLLIAASGIAFVAWTLYWFVPGELNTEPEPA